jgi:hypothetical protein
MGQSRVPEPPERMTGVMVFIRALFQIAAVWPMAETRQCNFFAQNAAMFSKYL